MSAFLRTDDPVKTRRLLVQNTLYLTVSQVLAMPLSVLTTAIAAHYLGAASFGYAYLAMTMCVFGFQAVGWGHENVLPAVVARDRTVAGDMLASSLAWRAGMSLIVYVVLAFACYLLDYPSEMQWALVLSALFMALTYFVQACKDTIRGLERTDIPAYIHVGQQVLAVALVFVAMALGGKLRAALLAQSAAAALVLIATLPSLRSLGVGRLSIRWSTIASLFKDGTPFVIFGVAIALQPNIDALFLSKLSPADVMGWYGVSRRLIGTLLLPATTIIGALYPTLCRLYAHDRESFSQTANGALRSVALLAVPVAVCCGLFPEIGVAMFSRESFRPAEDNLRISSVYVALVYLSMPLGTTILAAGKQRAWGFVQCLCVAASFILDPILVPIFQRQMGNGGLGLCVASVISEAVMIGCGVWLAPKGVFDQKLMRVVAFTLVSGAGMIAAAQLVKPFGPFVAAPLSLAAYAAGLWLMGVVDKDQLTAIASAVMRKPAALAPAVSNL
ncbi:MAG TPA: oligosaccharide flippase family protein [Vicinamibacterales bacterium]|nr:oligosaccharide flippase family protein [Vicinamibacterales bacterium]